MKAAIALTLVLLITACASPAESPEQGSPEQAAPRTTDAGTATPEVETVTETAPEQLDEDLDSLEGDLADLEALEEDLDLSELDALDEDLNLG